jgi:tetratricopeptide (TPR) repeat protein
MSLARETHNLAARAVTRQRSDSSDLHTLGAYVELYSGNHRAALAELEKVRDTTSIAFVHAVRADAYAALKRPDSALRAARAADAQHHWGWEPQDEWIRATLRVGRNSEALGDKAAARDAYRRYVERWKNADPEIPELIEAKRALARLTQ